MNFKFPIANSRKGYIALITVIIISAVVLVIGSTISLLAIGDAQSSLAGSKGESSLQFVEGCAEDALLKEAQQGSSYNGGNIQHGSDGTCIVTVNNGTIIVTSTATDYNRTIQVSFTRTGNTIALNSWQESLPVMTPTPTPAYTLSGTVFVDSDGNGIQGSGESGYTGVDGTATMALSGAGSQPVNGSGGYSFANVAGGNYTLTLTPPGNYYTTTTNPLPVTLSGNTTKDFGILKWFDTGYKFKKKITIDHTQVSASLSSFPVWINLVNDPDLLANVQNSNGYDILFTNGNETAKLNYEIEKYNATNGTLKAWVKIPTLSASADTTLYMYYDNSSISSHTDTPHGVWDGNYEGVWHMPDGTTLDATDSTSNINNGTNNGGAATNGQVDGAVLLKALNGNYISVTETGSLDIQPQNTGIGLTEEVWMYLNSAQAQNEAVIGNTGAYNLFFNTATSIRMSDTQGNNFTCSYAFGTGSWYHVVVTINPGSSPTETYYVNGAQVCQGSSGTWKSGTGWGTFYIGWDGNTAAPHTKFDGKLDEIRLSNSVRSADWVKTEYTNQTSSTFVTETSGAIPFP